MEPFKEILTAGGHANSLGRAGEVVAAVQSDLSRLDELFECIYADDAWVRMRAVDSFEKIINENPRLARPYLGRIFNELAKSTQPSVQWHLAQLFAEVELSASEQQQAAAWLKERISSLDTDWIVAVNSMKTLLQFYRDGLVAKGDVAPLFELQKQHSSKTVRKKATQYSQDL